jgi:FtsP/CotA-like multicopper oxidase with cupredoxin domain
VDDRENGGGPVTLPAGAGEPEPSTAQPTRRQFLTGALAFSGLALSGGLLEAAAAHASPAAAESAGAAAPPDPLRIGEIVRNADGKLRGVITIRSGQRTLPGTSSPTLLRYLEGKDAKGQVVWPPAPTGPALPGPTLRARVGDQVELTFLNHVNVAEFGNTIDRVERGLDDGCQRVVNGQTGTELYPGRPPTSTDPTKTAQDHAPDCFHGSSTTNIHFHGTHVTPDGLGDNVLLQLRPNMAVTEESVAHDFDLIFRAGPPRSWSDLPRSWRERQIELLRVYDETAPWQGKNPTPRHPVLPPDQQLLPPTLELINHGMWPQYQIGAYPYCFRLTEYKQDAQGNPIGPRMGQSPGTHWYHAHKHGSTAINVYNGMVGAFIIEGEYDDALHRIYPNLVQHVLLVQNLAEEPPLMRAGAAAGPTQTLYVNGLLQPTISMKPGEIQLWRLVNTSVRSVTTLLDFEGAPGSTAKPEMRQIAQDGVQFRWENFRDQPRLPADPKNPARANAFATGNRVDLLVRAPDTPGSWTFSVQDTPGGGAKRTILKVEVEQGTSLGMNFPTEREYPKFPDYLKDIDPAKVHIRRTLDFGWNGGPGLGNNGAPRFTIDGRQFEGDRYDQTMILDDTEEWTILNTTQSIAHPFHIHVNPFQVVEIFDPSQASTPYRPAGNFIWQDTVAIPPAVKDSSGNLVPGYVKIRHSFVDFTGSYVLHCHMLAHEDRGMMQLLRVISARTMVPHH